MENNKTTPNSPSWHSVISKYNKPKLSRSLWQIINSLGPYIMLWVLMVMTLKISFLLTIPLIILASGFLIRIFIIFHDCGHGSFFRSRKLNVAVGKLFGILAFTPYHKWTDNHRIHHQTVGNLDRRGRGDVWTLTVEEYRSGGKGKRIWYRIFRHPVFMMLIGGPLSFLILSRFSTRKLNRKQRMNVYFTNLVLLGLVSGMIWLIGWKAFLLIQLPVMYLASIGGVYLFYLQHQYDDVYWCRTEEWDFKEVALQGSSFFKLPAILRWFSGNIGYHHVHHLGSTIPNYNLMRCHEENPMFHKVKPITFFRSFHSLKLRLWDEKRQKIVSFRGLKSDIII